MGVKIPTTASFNLPDGTEVVIETGKLAAQADGSVVVRIGDTMLFCSVVSSHELRDGQNFFPLSVDYQEKFAAAGRIPGNFFRRETRLNDYEILTSRLVDRVVRPLFPDGYMYETQIIINLISGDAETLPDAYAALAASSALMVSDIPFAGPLSEVRVARIDGKFVVNPSRSDLEMADMEIIVGATDKDVAMVEGEAQECSEADLVEAIKVGHEAIKLACAAQVELAQKVGDKALVKREIPPVPTSEEAHELVKAFTTDKIYAVAKGKLEKHTRKAQFKAIKEELKAHVEETKDDEWKEEHGGFISAYFEKHKKTVIREMVMAEEIRLDGRALNTVRPIWTEVNYLPSTHGSAIFTRGETQALASLTLGSKKDNQMVDTALHQGFDDFILHYNFPALSVGEIKPMRGPGRREVGHANLAARSLKQVLPEDNPYTIRIVSDILESNGSSSMATVCSGSMSLMDAGVKIKAPVAGIAMGMIADDTRKAILTDILGDEDALGDMDFKVTGTEKGITGCQMDIKIDGLPYDLLIKALEQAKEGRIHILGEMAKTIADAREDYKDHAPRITEIRIDKSFIGAVIGPGGSIIKEIQAETNTVINIEEVDDKGVVTIASVGAEGMKAAMERIKSITFTPEVGDVFDAKVASIQPYGVFVDFNGGSGLLHVSEIAYERVERVEDFFKEGDAVQVKLVGIDQRTGKLRLSRKALLEKPEGYVEREERPRRDDRRGGGRDDRRGGGRDRRDDRRR